MTDWTAVEVDYRAGLLSLRQMAKKHGCSHTRVRQVATAKGWQRHQTEPAQEEARSTGAAQTRKLPFEDPGPFWP